MDKRYIGLCLMATSLLSTQLAAQPSDFPIPPAVSTTLPPGISVKKTAVGDVYVDAKGRTLYGMDIRVVDIRSKDRLNYCTDACTQTWQPVVPPPGTPAGRPQGAAGVNGRFAAGGLTASGAASAAAAGRGAGNDQRLGMMRPVDGPQQPDWTMVETRNGPQLLYKTIHLVYVRKDEAPGSVKWDGSDDQVWNALKYVPPVPKMVAPAAVTPIFVGGAYAMVDKDQHILYTCATAAACGKAVPLKAGFVSQGLGAWTVSRSGDSPQWLYKGKPVFVSQGQPKSMDLPQGAAILRP